MNVKEKIKIYCANPKCRKVMLVPPSLSIKKCCSRKCSFVNGCRVAYSRNKRHPRLCSEWTSRYAQIKETQRYLNHVFGKFENDYNLEWDLPEPNFS